MKKIQLFLFSIALIISSSLMAQEPAPTSYDFSFPDSNGKQINITASEAGLDFKEAKGKVILLNFFGKKCPPCLMEIPHLIEIQDDYKKDFEIIALQVQKPMSPEELNAFIKEKKLNYQVADHPDMQDFTGFIMSAAQWKGMIPFMILFDQKGVVRQMYSGMVAQSQIRSDIDAILAKK
ncbi:MAG: TlpA disulfide reductase family protein [Campylobacterota bacterium]|nr:TlpA disulfide reductase family protein [Campylobacterota bacterium]